MFEQSHIYVIAFDSGTLKVGRAADGASRIATHRREPGRHGVAVLSEWCSPPCGERAAAHYEQQLIEFCASQGALRAGAEYFGDLDFLEVQRFAERLVGVTDPQSPHDDEDARSPVGGPRALDQHGFVTNDAPLEIPHISELLPRPWEPTRTGQLTLRAKPGSEPDQACERLRARMPTPDESILLDLPPGEPVMEVLRIIRAADGQVIEFARSIHVASRFVWSFEFDIPD